MLNKKTFPVWLLCLILICSLFSVRQVMAEVSWPESTGIQADGGILMDADSGAVLYEKNADQAYYPASITKILTALVAAEHITEADLDQAFTMTIDITDYCYVNWCSVVGLMVGETVSVRELFYGTILPSGADAALGLATYVAGS